MEARFYIWILWFKTSDDIFIEGYTSNFLFILRPLLIKLDSVVYLLRYYFIKVIMLYNFNSIFHAGCLN